MCRFFLDAPRVRWNHVISTFINHVFGGTGRDFTRESRQLLCKLRAAVDDDSNVSVDSIRTARALRLGPAAMAKLKALQGDKKMAALWKVISPGKKAAASGTAGSSGTQQITDAMRTAVAAAAARAVAAAHAALQK